MNYETSVELIMVKIISIQRISSLCIQMWGHFFKHKIPNLQNGACSIWFKTNNQKFVLISVMISKIIDFLSLYLECIRLWHSKFHHHTVVFANNSFFPGEFENHCKGISFQCDESEIQLSFHILLFWFFLSIQCKQSQIKCNQRCSGASFWIEKIEKLD